MSTGQVLGFAGMALGGFFFGPVGAALGWTIGNVVGNIIDPQQVHGPRLEDLKVQISSFGAPIPRVYGTVRIAGNVIWASDLVEHATSSGGGKGGGPEVISYTYTMSYAVLVCEGPIAGITRIWANKKLIYDVRVDSDGGVFDTSVIGTLKVYLGTEDQLPDSRIVAEEGAQVSAWRGYAYVVFEDIDVTSTHGRPLQMEFEVVSEGTNSWPPVQAVGTIHTIAVDHGGVTIDPIFGYVWSAYVESSTLKVHIANDEDRTDIANIVGDPTPGAAAKIAYSGPTREAILLLEAGGVETEGLGWMWILVPGGAPNINVINCAARTITPSPVTTTVVVNRIAIDNVNPVYGSVVWLLGNGEFEVWFGGFPTGPIGVPQDTFTAGNIQGCFFPDSSTGIDHQYVVMVVEGYLEFYDRQFFTFQERVSLNPTVSPSFLGTYGLTPGGHVCCIDKRRNRIILGNTSNDSQICVADFSNRLNVTVTEINLTSQIGSVGIDAIIHHEGLDKYILTRHSGGTRSVYVIDPDSFVVETNIQNDVTFPSLTSTNLTTIIEVPDVGHYVLTGDVYRVPIIQRLSNEGVPLSVVVGDICEQCDLTDGADFDVSQLAAYTVDGYVLGRQMTGRNAIETLQPAYYFDGVESDDQLKFVVRGGAIAAIIQADDRAAHEAGSEAPPDLEIVRSQELELPNDVEVKFFDAARDYDINTSYDRRITRSGVSLLTLDLPIVMTPLKASQVAAVNLYNAWRRQSYRWRTTWEYADLEPTDVVQLQTADVTYSIRITAKRELLNGIIEWEGREEDSYIYTQNGVASSGSAYESQVIGYPPRTFLVLLDSAMASDSSGNDVGIYAAAAGVTDSWTGSALMRSSDGSTYSTIETFSDDSYIGIAESELGDFGGGNMVDHLNQFNVRMFEGTLASCTLTEMLAGANVIAVGANGRWEIVQFMNATLVSPGLYTLSGLLRGRRGTEFAIDQHVGGDAVIVFNSLVKRITTVTSEIGARRYYKAPANGQLISAAIAQSLTLTGASLKPYAPVQLGIGRDGSGNITIVWQRRTRVSGEWRDSVDVPLSETEEAYEIDILDGEDGDAVRTIEADEETCSYTVAQQAADFGSPTPATIYVRVYQMSSSVGRGYALEGSG